MRKLHICFVFLCLNYHFQIGSCLPISYVSNLAGVEGPAEHGPCSPGPSTLAKLHVKSTGTSPQQSKTKRESYIDDVAQDCINSSDNAV